MKYKNQIVVAARRWYDNSYGNTYFTVRVWVDGSLVYDGSTPEYGHGDMYLQRAFEQLSKLRLESTKLTKSGKPALGRLVFKGMIYPISAWCRDNNVSLINVVTDVGRKADL